MQRNEVSLLCRSPESHFQLWIRPRTSEDVFLRAMNVFRTVEVGVCIPER